MTLGTEFAFPRPSFRLASPEKEADIEKANAAYRQGLLIPSYPKSRGVVERITSPGEIAPLIRSGLVLQSSDGMHYYLTLGGLLGGSPLDELERKLSLKPPGQKSIFISYQWNQQELARDIQQQFEAKGFLVIRDESNLSHGVYLPGFMRIINHPNLDYVLVILSDSYLKSKNCMYEVNQMMQRYKYADSLLPYVMMDDPTTKADIYSGIDKYVKYWKEKLQEAERANNLVDIDVIQNILRNCQEFTETIRSRINVSEAELKSNGYRAFFEMIATREKESDVSKEVIPLLNKALVFEKTRQFGNAEKQYKDAIDNFLKVAHLDGIDELGARAYGAYGEFLKRQKRPEAEECLEIAKNFGYQEGANSSSPSVHSMPVVAAQANTPVNRNNLNNLDFSSLGKSDQEAKIRQMADVVWEDLTLQNAHALRDQSLRDFNFARLISLNLSGCTNLTQEVVKQIIDGASAIQKLNLSEISSLQQVQDVNGQPLDLHNLTDLILNRCRRLNLLKVKGSQLSKVECEDTSLDTLDILAPKLFVLNLKRNKQLKDDALERSIKQCPKITSLELEGCDNISDKELKMNFPQTHNKADSILLHYKGDAQKAKLHIEQQISTLRAANNANNQAKTAELLTTLGKIHKITRDIQGAKTAFEQAVAIYNLLPQKPLQAAEAYFNLILCTPNSNSTNFWDSSSQNNELLFMKAFSIIRNIQAPPPGRRATVEELNTLCNDFYGNKDKYAAEDLVLIAQSYHCLGQLTTGNEAIKNYERAKQVYVEAYGSENHFDIADLCIVLANAYSQAQNFDQALECWKKAMEVTINCYGTEKHIGVAKIYLELGRFVGNRNAQEAAEWYNKALLVYEGFPNTLNEQADINYELSRLYHGKDSGLQYHDKWLQIKISQTQDIETQASIYRTAALSIDSNTFPDRAIRYFNKAIDLYKTIPIVDTRNYGNRYKHGGTIAGCYESIGDIQWAHKRDNREAWESAIFIGRGHGAFDVSNRCAEKEKWPEKRGRQLDNPKAYSFW